MSSLLFETSNFIGWLIAITFDVLNFNLNWTKPKKRSKLNRIFNLILKDI